MRAIETAAALARPLQWQQAHVVQIVVETFRVKSVLLRVVSWQGHLPGQHIDIRLTAEDGYQGSAQLFHRLATGRRIARFDGGACGER